MSLLTKAWNFTRTALGHVWDVVLDAGWSVWNEIQEGSGRVSWWLLAGLIWFSGVVAHAWLWAS